jgi:hypothetical protein
MFARGKCNINAFIAHIVIPTWVQNEGIYRVV